MGGRTYEGVRSPSEQNLEDGFMGLCSSHFVASDHSCSPEQGLFYKVVSSCGFCDHDHLVALFPDLHLSCFGLFSVGNFLIRAAPCRGWFWPRASALPCGDKKRLSGRRHVSER